MLIENGIVFTGKDFEEGLSIRLMNGIVQENVNGFVYKNEEEFAKCLKTFANFSTEKKMNIKKVVRNTVPEDSCIEMAKQYVEIYEKTPLIE